MNSIITDYHLLEIEPNSSIEDIKKAYRRLSIKLHPDKTNNTTNEKFNNISTAYKNLIEYKKNNNNNNSNNNNSNNDYDYNCSNGYMNNGNTNGNSNGNTNGNTNTNSNGNSNTANMNSGIYNNINYKNNALISLNKEPNNVPDFNDFTYSNNNSFCEDLELLLDVTYEQAYNGSNLPVNITRMIINNNYKKTENETLYVKIPSGIDNNELIIIKNKGNCYNYQYSNLKIIIKLLVNENFTRNGINIIFKKNITFKESLIGINFTLTHLNNKSYKIQNNNGEILNNNSIILLPKLGFKRDDYYGDLIIKFNIDYPKSLSLETIDKLRNIL